MAIKLNKEEGAFRNELIFTAHAKAVNIDNTLVNLFMLLRYNGIRPRQRAREGGSIIEISTLKKVFEKLEKEGSLTGYSNNPEAIEMWLRCNLVNMVFRGNIENEKLTSLRPIHLESYKVRNASTTLDYSSADQVYLMLGANPKVKEDLKQFLIEGWDVVTNKINPNENLDVDSLGILHIIKTIAPGFLESQTSLNQIHPILEIQANLYCDDVRRLLIYKNKIPRNVLIDYLKTITSFHLAIYLQKLVHLLPKMIQEGSKDVEDDWSIVLDSTDSFESKISEISIEDSSTLFNSIYEYLESTFKINMVMEYLQLKRDKSENIDTCLAHFKKNDPELEVYFKMKFNELLRNVDDEDKLLLEDITRYENSNFDKYLAVILNIKSKHQLTEHKRMISNLCQNNSDRGIMASGKSKKHPRRFILGTRLLETLVQILVLERNGDDFITRSLSIEELTKELRTRYGLIINGLDEKRFEDAGVNTHLAFKENMDAFKSKLRQIGFYNDLSDAYILQRIRPRYEINK
jgi:hypothetical protein